MAELPPTILEALIPGYAVIQRFFNEVFNFDITLVVTVCALLFGLHKAIELSWRFAYQQFSKYCMSYILISEEELREQVMDWIAEQNISRESRCLTAELDHGNGFDDPFADASEDDSDSGDGTTDLTNSSHHQANTLPKFMPSFGEHYFFHRGKMFIMKRDQKQVIAAGHATSSFDEENLTLTCIGRSTAPLKALIQTIREHHGRKSISCTTVRRPAPRHERERGRSWKTVAIRPSRPMHTVVLDHHLKQSVLQDINEYLQPATRRWYAYRGVPYRRGYLLHGPPGCGKSSLAWAIAGVFGLEIYCISLVDPGLTEEHLTMLFTALPRRCVVLLEDIDSAGLGEKRTGVSSSAGTKDKEDELSSDASKIGAEIAKALASGQKRRIPVGEDGSTGITLSGLLNAIDGVASHEGRVLVMTTNCPDKLDDALIRPGRIDMKIEFTHATKGQIHELFTRMYSPEDRTQQDAKSSKMQSKQVKRKEDTVKFHLPVSKSRDTIVTCAKTGMPTPPDSPRNPTAALSLDAASPTDALALVDIEDIANQFTDLLPEKTFTPAEIQGFLLMRKKEPQRALEEVACWRDRLIASKAISTKASDR